MIKLTDRLNACASLVRKGSRLADIGCDHGYIPVYLVSEGIIESAVASDINEGPLNSCRSLVRMSGLEDRIKCVLSDGLDGIETDEIDDILIAGVGGELIADILKRCAYAREKHIILNPMTHPELARKWLFNNGFEIINDIIVPDGRHHYSVFDACYTGELKERSEADYFLGSIEDFSDGEYFLHLINYLKNKQKSGEDLSAVISAIEEKIK